MGDDLMEFDLQLLEAQVLGLRVDRRPPTVERAPLVVAEPSEQVIIAAEVEDLWSDYRDADRTAREWAAWDTDAWLGGFTINLEEP